MCRTMGATHPLTNSSRLERRAKFDGGDRPEMALAAVILDPYDMGARRQPLRERSRPPPRPRTGSPFSSMEQERLQKRGAGVVCPTTSRRKSGLRRTRSDRRRTRGGPDVLVHPHRVVPGQVADHGVVPGRQVDREHPLPDRWEQLRTIARNQGSRVRCDVRTGHLTGARRERKKEVVPSNLRLGLSASYCPFGLSASRIVGGPFGPFLSITRNRAVRYSAPVQAPRDFRPFLFGTRSPVVLPSRIWGLWWWSSGPGLPPPQWRESVVSASEPACREPHPAAGLACYR